MEDIIYSSDGVSIGINFTDQFVEVWTDKGSDGKYDGSFFRVDTSKIPAGYYALGDLSKQGHQDPTGIHAIAIVRAVAGDALKEPTDYKEVWTDKGSDADQDVSVWEPIPPAGYVAMGYITQQGHEKPSTDRIRCVKSNLVVAASVDEFIWDSRGSGSDEEFSTWSIATESADAGWIFFSAKTFIGHDSTSKPSSNPCTYVFRTTFNETGPVGQLTPSQLEGQNPPADPTQTGSATTTCILPWFAVTDPTLTESQKLNQSIWYKQIRVDQYVSCGDYTYNDTSGNIPYNGTRASGKVEAGYNSFSQNTGIKIDVAFVIPDPEDPTKVNAQFGYGFSQTTVTGGAWATKSSQSFSETIPPYTGMGFYQVQSTYTLYRYPETDPNSTTEISNAVIYYAPGNVTVVQYPS